MHPIGEAAQLSGVSIETIRYYERAGILAGAPCSASGRRMFDGEGVARLRFIRRCRDLGFSMAEARSMLELAGNEDRSCAEIAQIASAHLVEVRAKIVALRQMASRLDGLVGECADGEKTCPFELWEFTRR